MAFTCAVDVRQNVCVVNADGTGFRRLTFRGPEQLRPSLVSGRSLDRVRPLPDRGFPPEAVRHAVGRQTGAPHNPLHTRPCAGMGAKVMRISPRQRCPQSSALT